jgi:hypothetical protein
MLQPAFCCNWGVAVPPIASLIMRQGRGPFDQGQGYPQSVTHGNNQKVVRPFVA